MVDPRLLRTFLAIAREGSISGAARRLNVSQPAVSVGVAQLERELGAALFQRGRRGVTPTVAGTALMLHAERLDVLLRDARETVALASASVRGPLHIGGTPGALVSLVPHAIARMEAEGRLSVTIVEGNDAELTDLLRRGTIEVAVVTTAIDAPPEDIEETTISRDPFALIVGPAYRAPWPSVSLRELTESAWVLPRAAGAFHRQIQSLFLAAEAPYPRDVVRCDSLLTSKAIVRCGRRVTILPRGVVEAELAAGVLRALAISDATISRSVGLRTLRGAALSNLARQFVGAVAPLDGQA